MKPTTFHMGIRGQRQFRRLALESLEIRRVLDGDPLSDSLWAFENLGQDLRNPADLNTHLTGSGVNARYDADIDLPDAWTELENNGVDTSRSIVAVFDTGVDYMHPDLYLNIWLNEAEFLPRAAELGISIVDADQDGRITFWDLNDSANHDPNTGLPWVQDAGDLIGGPGEDTIWETADGPGGMGDFDGNGYDDDFIGWDFDGNDNDPRDGAGHGTHVAGIIGAVRNNEFGVAGVADKARVLPIKVEFVHPDRLLSAYSYVTGIQSATSVADRVVAINMSQGVPSSMEPTQFPGADDLRDAVILAGQAGILSVFSAGNGSMQGSDAGNDIDDVVHYPAILDEYYECSAQSPCMEDFVISVAASDINDHRAYLSNYGQEGVDLAAPGARILSTVIDGEFAYSTGTSMAAPHVAGVLALMAASAPEVAALDLKNAILNGADRLPQWQGRTVSGARLNAFGALQAVETQGFDVIDWPLELPQGQPSFKIEFSLDVDASTASQAFDVVGAGPDLILGTSDDTQHPSTVTVSGNDVDLGLGALPVGDYRIIAAGDLMSTVATGSIPLLGGNNDNLDFQVTDVDEIVVTIADDVVNGDITSNDISLREAVQMANANFGHSTISFSSSLFGHEIQLDANLGALQLLTPMTVDGSAALTISGGDATHLFNVESPDATIMRLSIARGNAVAPVFAGAAPGNAAAIWVSPFGELRLENTVVRENDGTAIAAEGGRLTSTASTFRDNAGAAISSKKDSPVTVNNSLFLDNAVAISSALGYLLVTNSTFAGHSSAAIIAGLAEDYFDTPNPLRLIVGSTFSNNTASFATIASMTQDPLIVVNSLFNNPGTATELWGSFDEVLSNSNFFRVLDPAFEDMSAPGLYGTSKSPLDAMLGPLADNGGKTLTFALQPGSPAQDNGNNVWSGLGGQTDQRGQPYFREYDDVFLNIGGRVDIGAFELQPLSIHCDLDNSAICDIQDMRVLYDEIDLGASGGTADLNGDGIVDNDDITVWLEIAGLANGKVYLPGDTDLDGSVLGNDFTTLALNFGHVGLPGSYWDQGNFNGNGDNGLFEVGGDDFTQLAANFGHVSLIDPVQPASTADSLVMVAPFQPLEPTHPQLGRLPSSFLDDADEAMEGYVAPEATRFAI